MGDAVTLTQTRPPSTGGGGGTTKADYYFNVMDYGATGNGATDDLAAINTCFAAALAFSVAFSYTGMSAVVFFPAGIYSISGPIVNPANASRSVSIQGAGMSATRIVCASDFGAGQVAIPTPAKGIAGGGRYFIRDLSLVGHPASNTLGVSPCAMDGLEIPASGWAQNVNVSYFHYGIIGYNDHWHLYNVTSQGSYINLWWDTDRTLTPGTGDQYIEGCNFSSAKLASMGLSETQSMQGAQLNRIHFGFAPIGVYAEAMSNPASPVPISYVSNWEGCSFESVGNALIYSEDKLRDFVGATFTDSGPATVPDGNFYLNTKGNDYSIVAASVSNNTMLDANSSQMLSTTMAVGCIDATFFASNYFHGATLSWLTSKFTGGKIWINPAADISSRGTGDSNRFGGAETEGTFLRCGGTVGQWKVVDYDAATGPLYGRVVEHTAGGSGIIRGLAAAGGSSNTIVPVVERGSARAYYDAAYNNGGGDRIKPSTSVNGKVTTATGSELGVLGMSRYAATDTANPGEVTLLGGSMGFTKSSAYTQTYSTTSRTNPNATVSAVATTAATQTTPYGFTTQAQADAIPVAINANAADILATKKLLNAVIDDLQAAGVLG